MDFLDLVTAARTCRRFRQSEGMPGGTLDWLVECARRTPCGSNAQILRFALVESPEGCAAIYPALKWAAFFKDWDGPDEGERPAGYVIILIKTEFLRAVNKAIDIGIAAQTIQLAAQSRDIGCCMLLSFNHDSIKQTLDIPEDYEPVLVLALGLQKEIRVMDTATDEEGATRYWRDDKGVHHVPKLPLERLVIDRK